MENSSNATKESQGMGNKQLVTLTKEELKKEELISVLAGLIKNYANKKQEKL